MSVTQIILIIGILSVMVYDFTNGFHDAADMIATAIASMSMTPNIKGVPPVFSQGISISAMLAAITYHLIAWKLDLPRAQAF